jgi:hypothetical protein
MTFNYQTLDSSALKALEATSRKKALEALARTAPYQGESYDKVRRDSQTMSTTYITVREYYYSQRFLNIDEVRDAIASDPLKDGDFHIALAHKAEVFASIIENKPIIEPYTLHVKEVTALITEFTLKGESERALDELFRQIMLVQISYANDCVDFFSDHDLCFEDNIHAAVEDYIWDPSMTHSEQNSSKDILQAINFDELDEAQKAMDAAIGNEDLRVEILQFLLSPTLGSHGVALISPTCSPIYVKILPIQFTKQNAEKLILQSFNNGTYAQNIGIIRKTKDKALQYLEALAQQAIANSDPDRIRDGVLAWSMNIDQTRNDRGEQTPSSFQNVFGEPDSNNGTSKGKGKQQQHDSGNDQDKDETTKESHDDKSEDHDPEGSSSQQKQRQQQVPDDDDYHPELDSITLFILSKDYTKEVRSKPKGTLFHDHMARFNTTSESATTLSRDSIRRGKDGDYFITSGNQSGLRQFVVTFTRKSRKPIFNPVL